MTAFFSDRASSQEASEKVRGSTPIRILLFIDNFDVGGSQRQFVYTANQLVNDPQLDIFVGCFRLGGDLLRELEVPRERCFEFPLDRFYDLRGFRKIVELTRLVVKSQIDLIHAWDFYSNVFCAAAVGWLPGKRLVVGRRYLRLSDRRLHRFGQAVSYRVADLVVCNSQRVADRLTDAEGIDDGKIVVIPNGLPTRDFHSAASAEIRAIEPTDACRIGIVARLDPRKRHDVLLEAVSSLVGKWRGLSLRIVGDGECRASIIQKIDQLGLGEHVNMAGHQQDVRPWVSDLDLAVLSSEVEGFPNVLLEYMALGRPIVATRVGGVPELVRDGREGLLVPPGDPASMADAIDSLLGNVERRREMSRAGVARSKAYDVTRMTDGTRRLYRHMLEANGSAWRPGDPEGHQGRDPNRERVAAGPDRVMMERIPGRPASDGKPGP